MLLKKIKGALKYITTAKISVKLTLVYALMFSIALLILNSSILYGVKFYLYNQVNKQVDDVKSIILDKVTSENENIDLADKQLLYDIPSKENISIRILQGENKVLNVSKEFDYTVKLKEPFDKIKHLEREGRHLVFENIKFESKKYGVVYLQVLKDMEKEYDFMEILFIIMAIADFIGIIISIIMGYVVSKRMLRPIDYITKTAENISINNLKERIEVEGPEDELKRLGDTFNKMIDRLQSAFDRQAQFVSDASHELRTPISVIQGYANLLDRWGKDDKGALEKSIYAIKLEAANMADLVEKLLFLAKGESGTQKVKKESFSLNDLVDEVVRETKLIAPNHIISKEKNDIVNIFADYKMIKQMLRIFIDNSIKFAPENSIISIGSEVQDNTVRLTVIDRGMGIPKNEINKIFDRFYTVDKSRSKEKGGTGLGLSIAKWIADIHHGSICIESEENKFTKVTVELRLEE